MKKREGLFAEVDRKLRSNPVVMLLGPRQCGKTTLARELAANRKAHWFDLESPSALNLMGDPHTALKELRGLVVIDEAQRQPSLLLIPNFII